MLAIPLIDDLCLCDHGPTDPHEPAVDRHYTLLSVQDDTVASFAIQNHVEVTVVTVVVVEVPVVRAESVDHLDVLVKWDIIGSLP